jgi:hypothetical protein
LQQSLFHLLTARLLVHYRDVDIPLLRAALLLGR